MAHGGLERGAQRVPGKGGRRMENGHPSEDSTQLSWRQRRERLMNQTSEKVTGLGNGIQG